MLLTHSWSRSFLGIGKPCVELSVMIVVTAAAAVNESFIMINAELANVTGELMLTIDEVVENVMC